MDKYRELYENLLKADGIDPAKVTDSDRALLGAMLETETRRMKRLSWLTVGGAWVFFLVLLALVISERLLESLHIPFIAAYAGVVTAFWILYLTVFRRHVKRNKDSQRKVRRLEFLVNGKRFGLPLVGKRNGRKVIRWGGVVRMAVMSWLLIAAGGAVVYWLLSRRWPAFPLAFVLQTTIASLVFVISMLIETYRTPLDQLTDLDETDQTAGPDSLKKIMKNRRTPYLCTAVVLIAVLAGIYLFGLSIDGARTAFGRMIEAVNDVPWIHVVSYTDTASDEWNESRYHEEWFSFQSKTKAALLPDGTITYYDGNQHRSYEYDPESKTVQVRFWDPSFSITEEGRPLSTATLENYFNGYLAAAANPEAEISRLVERYDGRTTDVFQVRITNDQSIETITYYTDPVTHLPERLEIVIDSPGETTRFHYTVEYPLEGPESIYDLGVPPDARRVADWLPSERFLEVWDRHRTCRSDFHEAVPQFAAVITKAGKRWQDGRRLDHIDHVTIEYKETPRYSAFKYQLEEGVDLVDQPHTVDELPPDFDEILEWSYSVRTYPYYGGKKTGRMWQDSHRQPESIRYSWPVDLWKDTDVIEDSCSIENSLICIETIQPHPSDDQQYDRFLYYLNPQRDYICEKRVSQWAVRDGRCNKVHTTDVIEYNQTDSGQWYAAKIKMTAFENQLQTYETQIEINLKTDVDFPETVFDETTDLPEYN